MCEVSVHGGVQLDDQVGRHIGGYYGDRGRDMPRDKRVYGVRYVYRMQATGAELLTLCRYTYFYNHFALVQCNCQADCSFHLNSISRYMQFYNHISYVIYIWLPHTYIQIFHYFQMNFSQNFRATRNQIS